MNLGDIASEALSIVANAIKQRLRRPGQDPTMDELRGIGVENDLRELFGRYFEIHCDVGSSEDLLDEALKLRYQVYCVEHAYEDPAAFPDEMERDIYDGRSLHSLLIHRATHLSAGTVRLIRPDANEPLGSLPIESLCNEPTLSDESRAAACNARRGLALRRFQGIQTPSRRRADTDRCRSGLARTTEYRRTTPGAASLAWTGAGDGLRQRPRRDHPLGG